jgi:IS30 family transposase
MTPSERDCLAVWKAEGVSIKECARRLGREPSTISRELKRNGWKKHWYVAIHAQGKADTRRQQVAHSKQPLKNPDVYAYVTRHLHYGWSPDQIAGRLDRLHPNDKHWHICGETIYQWIYQPQQVRCERPWYEYLRRKQKKRKTYKGRGVHREQIPDRVSIHVRPDEVNKRTVFGHWEGDTLEGKGHKNGVHTEVERCSRLITGRKVTAITSDIAVKAQQQIFGSFPSQACKSTTLDNGRETHLHFKLRTGLGMMTYHADPYSSWQRGSNENGNWHLRYYFPKGTDFDMVSEEELQEVIDEINARPRKILGYLTAQEMFDTLLCKEVGVALEC